GLGNVSAGAINAANTNLSATAAAAGGSVFISSGGNIGVNGVDAGASPAAAHGQIILAATGSITGAVSSANVGVFANMNGPSTPDPGQTIVLTPQAVLNYNPGGYQSVAG